MTTPTTYTQLRIECDELTLQLLSDEQDEALVLVPWPEYLWGLEDEPDYDELTHEMHTAVLYALAENGYEALDSDKLFSAIYTAVAPGPGYKSNADVMFDVKRLPVVEFEHRYTVLGVLVYDDANDFAEQTEQLTAFTKQGARYFYNVENTGSSSYVLLASDKQMTSTDVQQAWDLMNEDDENPYNGETEGSLTAASLHQCDERSVSDGGTMRYQGSIAAPGYGDAYECVVCGAPRVKLATTWIDPRESDPIELQPEDVI